MVFYIVAWKEFKSSKMTDKYELIKELKADSALAKMREFNAQKRLTTTDYTVFDVSELFDRKGLQIVEKIKSEDFISDDELKSPEPEQKPDLDASQKGMNMSVDG